jgi:hypothetical protein
MYIEEGAHDAPVIHDEARERTLAFFERFESNASADE